MQLVQLLLPDRVSQRQVLQIQEVRAVASEAARAAA